MELFHLERGFGLCSSGVQQSGSNRWKRHTLLPSGPGGPEGPRLPMGPAGPTAPLSPGGPRSPYRRQSALSASFSGSAPESTGWVQRQHDAFLAAQTFN